MCYFRFADRQNQLKLEAEEIGDKEAEESPVESEEDEANDESVSLENKEKRKERLKRLLHERSKRSSVGKENEPTEESKLNEGDANITQTNNEERIIKESETDIKEKKEDSDKILETSANDDKNTLNVAETLSVSDDSTNLESDIDELHLLQKLHSGDEAQTSTLESSDYDSPIAISDSLESGSDNNKQSDVISIENSSYSESEVDKMDKMLLKNTENTLLKVSDSKPNKETIAVDHAGMETECTNTAIETEMSNAVMNIQCLAACTQKPHKKSNNEEYTDAVEDILLASSDDENSGSQESATDGVCINLRDDLISIDETTIVGIVADKPEKENVILTDKDNKSDGIEYNTNNIHLKDDSQVNKKLNIDESMDTSYNDALCASKRESTQKNESVVSGSIISAEIIEEMDVDQDENATETVLEKKSNGLEEDLPLKVSSETESSEFYVKMTEV